MVNLYSEIQLSKRAMDIIKSKEFIGRNSFSPDEILEFWDYSVKLANEFEEKTGIVPSRIRRGITLEDMAEIRHARNAPDMPLVEYLEEHFDGAQGYSLWTASDSHTNVPTTYAVLNQIETIVSDNHEKQWLLSAALPFNWPVRIVHEDMYNHIYLFEGEGGTFADLYLKIKSTLKDPKVIDAIDAMIYTIIDWMDFSTQALYHSRANHDGARFEKLGTSFIRFPIHPDFMGALRRKYDVEFTQELRNPEIDSEILKPGKEDEMLRNNRRTNEVFIRGIYNAMLAPIETMTEKSVRESVYAYTKKNT